MLVNIHKLSLFLLLILIGLNTASAQIWTLQQCIDTAQSNNKNLKMSRNNVSIGEQKHKEAKANLIPKITANAEYRYYTNLPYQLMPLSAFGGPAGEYKAIQFGVPNLINANLQLTMPIYDPQVYGAIQTTEIASEMKELEFQKTGEQIYFEISNFYFNAQILDNQLAFIDCNLANAERLLKNTQLLNEQLLAKVTDVSKVKLQVSQLLVQKESVSSKLEQVLNALKFSMGVSTDQNIQIEPDIQFTKATNYTGSTTLDIKIAKKQNSLLNSEINTLTKSRFLPSLKLIGSYGTSGFGYYGQPKAFVDFYKIGFAGIQLSLPIFDGTVTQQKIDQKNLELQNNELQYSFLKEQNYMQTENAEQQMKVALNSVDVTTEQIELAQTIYEQTIIQQEQGIASLTDILLADNALREAQQTYLSAVIDYLKADLELKKLTGNIPAIK